MGKEYLSRVISSTTVVSCVLLVVYIFFRVGGPIPLSVIQTTKTATFDVSGEGTAEVVPDEARSVFGITSQASTVAAVQAQANEIINRLKSSLKEAGVEEKDVKTTAYNIYPDYSFDAGRSRITGYNANIQLGVTFRDFEKLNQAFDLATQAGANIVNNLSFELSIETRKKAEDEARKEAIGQAREKAEKIAREAGISLGRVINVQETPAPSQPIFRALAVGSPEEDKAQTEVSPGISEVKIQVTLSFETR